MKRALIGCALSLLLVTPLLAQQKSKSLHDQFSGQGYGTAGCGLGSIVFGEKPGMIQVFAATTNGLWGNQTFAISSGTSNCDDASSSAATRTNFFIAQNEAAVKNDIARGGGETLDSLARVMGCQSSSNLGQKLQANFGTIYTSDAVNSEIVGQRIRETVSSDCQG